MPQAAVWQETLYDELAEKVGQDRLEFRLLNALRDGDASATGQVMRACGIAECLTALRPHWKRALTEAASQPQRGVGIASCWYGCGNTGLPTARERLRASADAFIAYWEARPDRFRLLYMTPETMQPEAVSAPLASPQYESSVGLAMRLALDFIAEVGGDRKRATLARDLLTALMVGYLYSRIVNTRYPWGDFKALRRAVIDTILVGVEQSVRKAK